MPTYEYQCRACGHAFEAFQKMSDAPLDVCPKCQAKSVEKLVSAAGFQLKGTGWYVTDFRNKSEPKPTSQVPTKTETKKDSGSTGSSSTGEKSA
ncbi:MAG: zinc ribbon domain-containing protein [Gammaproteobacteria bacterium]|nr:zinc ribbon domain-containing protein [Gammaproteobacteria bacterium]